jgi:hypothetical protein
MSNVRRWLYSLNFHVSYLQDAHRPQTVLVENPKTIDEKGKLVSLSPNTHPDHNSFSFTLCQVSR